MPDMKIVEFVDAMEKQLYANELRGDWRKLPVEIGPGFIRHNLNDIESERVSPEKKRQQCVDIANFALMMWHQLQDPQGERRL